MNDSLASLRESIKTAPELADLVNSAADDLGVDLDSRPSAKDDELFHNALVEGTPETSTSFCQGDLSKALEEQHSEDILLHQTRRHLTDLLEARRQLRGELESIAKDLSAQHQEVRTSGPAIDPIRGVLSKASTVPLRTCTFLGKISADSITEEIHEMIGAQIDEGQLRSLFDRITIQSRRMSMITQRLQNLTAIPPEETRDLFEVASTELPATLVSITKLLETLPALDLEFTQEVEAEPECEQQYERLHDSIPELEPQLDQELERELYQGYAEIPSPDRTYTEPATKLHQRIIECKRRSEEEPGHVASREFSEDGLITPAEHAVMSVQGGIQPPMQTGFEQRPKDDGNPVNRTLTRRTTPLLPRKPTLVRHDTSEHSSLTSELGEPEEPVFERQQKIAKAELDIPSLRLSPEPIVRKMSPRKTIKPTLTATAYESPPFLKPKADGNTVDELLLFDRNELGVEEPDLQHPLKRIYKMTTPVPAEEWQELIKYPSSTSSLS